MALPRAIRQIVLAIEQAEGAGAGWTHRTVPTEGLVKEFHNVVFDQGGDYVEASVPDNAESESRFILVAGQPLDQKVVQYGPFVLTSQEEVYQAMVDYQTASNGFERVRGWESEIGKRMAF
ncbi:putative pirin [Aspergillus nomiae NRRL 13137]|uniref:Putative pirin n=1 Tax=Aspergillus nomiae NRRL (strain ATCC 15546 / NRRL 13137 / CBS 260.88 / M93) TaxID=1509407 RepID=A0A0L1JFN1_ASPN3|nr:putative pirin [Aspergillus nomiae NRRL 13137]KNG90570.1 putative pirin [Aspergillus nomiae NRRL 13137]